MPLPERMKPARVTRKQMKELVSQLNGILDHIDNGMDENNEELKQMMADWNAQVVIPCGFSDFRDFSSDKCTRFHRWRLIRKNTLMTLHGQN
ncbi:hypothetical protein BANRA_05234 [Klebsiella pneumoniae]|nr:hypothetical protein BANRA_05234 [Klebsiella pneumoniae]